MTTPALESPPPFKPGDAIELNSVEDSKIVGVSVYPGRAEVTRLFKLEVRTGQNQVHINGLPGVLDEDSFRVEGRGAATIHDVTISNVPRTPAPMSSPALEAFLQKKDRVVKALERCKKSLASLASYLDTLSVQHIPMSELRGVMADYDNSAEELDIRGLELEAQLKTIDTEIESERAKLSGTTLNDQLNRRAAIGIFAASGGEVEIALVYGVHRASWTAGYDIRVDMQAKEEPATLIYKAAITQGTGEDWTDVSLILETATPTFGVGAPTLDPWNISIYRPTPVLAQSHLFGSAPGASAPAFRARRSVGGSMMAGSALTDANENVQESLEEGRGKRTRSSAMNRRQLEVLKGKGNVSATFQVPGMISIPSDGVAHNVTIAELKLSASMSWVCVPKKDMKVHLKANLKNASEYTLLRGSGSVYVDGSFISRSEVPAVSPGESFDCPLGLDPSIRITYHPRVKKVSQSGFYSKSSNHVYSQQITVFNTKSTSVEDVRIVDQVPVSEDEQIKVKLVSPLLTVSSSGGSEGASKEKEKAVQKLGVAKGVVAQWDGADEPETDGDPKALGKNGKINWVCSVPPQGKINLVLQWEVTALVSTHIMGL